MGFFTALGVCALGLVLETVCTRAQQIIISTGSTLSLNGIPYYVPGKAFASGYKSLYATCAGKVPGSSLVPVTVVNFNAATTSLSALQTALDGFGALDDVWGDAFLSGEKSTPTFEDACFHAGRFRDVVVESRR